MKEIAKARAALKRHQIGSKEWWAALDNLRKIENETSIQKLTRHAKPSAASRCSSYVSFQGS